MADSPPQDADVYRALDLALRVGEILLANGAGSADVSATMLAVVRACGLRAVSPNVTFTEISLNYHPGGDQPSVLQSRSVTHREIDHGDLTAVDALVRDLLDGHEDLSSARHRIAQIASTGHGRPRWTVTVGYGVMGSGTALLVGGAPLVVGCGFVAAAGIDRIYRAMSVRRYPVFYQQVAGGLFAGLIGVGVAAADLPVTPARVVTAAVFMLLSGIGAVSAAQDALNGFPVTANARILEAVMATIGIIAGISAALALGNAFGVEVASMRPVLPRGEPDLVTLLPGAAVAAGAFAFATYSPLRALLPTSLLGALGAAVAALVSLSQLGETWGTAIAAVAVGAASYSVSAGIRVPSLVLLVPALLPLLPGLSLYRGLVNLTEGGSTQPLVVAAGTAIALASGAILGQYLAQPLHRTTRRLETKLAGPRLVGPLRVAAKPVRKAATRARRGNGSGSSSSGSADAVDDERSR